MRHRGHALGSCATVAFLGCFASPLAPHLPNIGAFDVRQSGGTSESMRICSRLKFFLFYVPQSNEFQDSATKPGSGVKLG